MPSASRASDEGQPLLDASQDSVVSRASATNRSIVEFSCPVFFGDRLEGECSIDVLRIGSLEGACSVRYSTQDISAQAGTCYEATAGECSFGKGEYLKTIHIPFIHSNLWNATLEFLVLLDEPQNCKLGTYLHTSRVKVLDEHVFPSNAFQEKVAQRDFQGIHGMSLFLAYFRWNAVTSHLILATVLTLIFDQLGNIYHLVLVLADMYLVNVVLNPHASEDHLVIPGGRQQNAYFIASLHVLPWVALLLWQCLKDYLDILGRSTKHLQEQMYRKFMNLSVDVVEANGAEELDFGLLSEAPVVASGYMAALTLVQKSVNVLLNVYLVVKKTPVGLPFVMAVVACVILWGFLRELLAIPVVKAETTAVTHLVKEAAQKHELICQFLIRPMMNARFVEASETLRQKALRRILHLFVTNAVLSIIGPIFVGGYIVMFAGSVWSGSLDLGTFLALIRVINTVASESVSSYQTLGTLVHTFAMLRNVTAFYNRETEVRSNRTYNLSRRERSQQLLAEMASPDVDQLPIVCEGLGFSAGGADIVSDVNLHISQGQVVGVHGPHGCGKNLLLSILGHLSEKTSGNLFVPSHMRTLVVPREVLFLDAPLLTNLTLGQSKLEDEDVARLRRILKDFHLEKLLAILDKELADSEDPKQSLQKPRDTWSRSLSRADKARVSLVRAIFMNPELLLLHRPLAAYTRPMMGTIRQLLMQHARNKGLHKDTSTVHLRRPRTLIFTSDVADRFEGADLILEMIPSGRKNADGSDVFTLKVDQLQVAK